MSRLDPSCAVQVDGDAARIKKLGIKPGQRAAVIDPPDGYGDRGPPEGVEVTSNLDYSFDFVQVFAEDRATLDRHLTAAHRHLGVCPVTPVSVDDVWSALRFRPYGEVGSRS